MATHTNSQLPQSEAALIKAMGHRNYVGGLWDTIGKLQLEFLKSRGLKPEHILLDVACGPLRAGVHFIDYLNAGGYLGLDKEPELVNRGIEQELSTIALDTKQPQFVISESFEFAKFSKIPDFAIAQSLFTHLTKDDISICLSNLKEFAGEKPMSFYATFFECRVPRRMVPAKSHSRVAFYYTRDQIKQLGIKAGWDVEYIGDWGSPRKPKMIQFINKAPAPQQLVLSSEIEPTDDSDKVTLENS
jgi:hypothetical protein